MKLRPENLYLNNDHVKENHIILLKSWSHLNEYFFFKILRVCLDIVYFAENWKHSSKIIFKCVNSAMRLIFNEKIVEK